VAAADAVTIIAGKFSRGFASRRGPNPSSKILRNITRLTCVAKNRLTIASSACVEMYAVIKAEKRCGSVLGSSNFGILCVGISRLSGSHSA
jgi:hypothetical protein